VTDVVEPALTIASLPAVGWSQVSSGSSVAPLSPLAAGSSKSVRSEGRVWADVIRLLGVQAREREREREREVLVAM